MDITNFLTPLSNKKKKHNSYNCKSQFREEIMNIHSGGLEIFETDILTEGSIMATKITA